MKNPLRFCDYCKAWNSGPCGEGCVWTASMPVADTSLRDAYNACWSRPPSDKNLLSALEKCLNFIENTESEMGETLSCGDTAREALAALAPAEGMGGDPFRTVATALLAEEEKERRMGWTLQLGWYVLAFEKLREAFMASSIDHLPPGHVVLEQADNLQGTISQTVRRPDGSEYERRVDADEAAPTTTREDEPEEDNWLEDPDMGAR